MPTVTRSVRESPEHERLEQLRAAPRAYPFLPYVPPSGRGEAGPLVEGRGQERVMLGSNHYLSGSLATLG